MGRILHVAAYALALGMLLSPVLETDSARSAPLPRAQYSGACTFDHVALKTAAGQCRPHARSYPPTVLYPVERAIYDGALLFGIPYAVLHKIAQCESSLNPHAAHAGHYGLYQFLPETFKRAKVGLKHEIGVAVRSYWSPLDSAYAAGYLFATGAARSWACE